MTHNWLSDTWRSSVTLIKQNQLLENGKKWGFAVIRPEGIKQEDWDKAISRVYNYIAHEFQEWDQRYKKDDLPEPDPLPTELVVKGLTMPVLQIEQPAQDYSATHDPTIMQDALLKAARSRFSDYVAWRQEGEEIGDEAFMENWNINNTACIVLDTKAISQLKDESIEPDDCHMIVLDLYEDHLERDFYHGWMYSQLSSISECYTQLRFRTMFRVCPVPDYQGQMPLYTGDLAGELIDPPGGRVGPKLGGTGRGTGRGK